ncbi:MAG: hypothetical protein JNM96_02730 [Bacteroidia bacterium]|nr:hypothetical protein [Bacteroidia bacterium]
MKFDTKGTKSANYKLSNLEAYLRAVSDKARWLYFGLTVEIDPTIDYSDSNVLIRWLDVNEGFNDKLIVNSLEEFNSNFKLIN